MKELDALMNALNEREIPKCLRITAKLAPFPENADTPEKKQALLKEAIEHSLINHFKEDEDLKKLFNAYCFEIGMNTLIKELDIKVPEESPSLEKFLAELLKKL